MPDYVLTNEELEKMVDTNDEWITTRTGIKERRILKGEQQGTSVMAVEVLKQLIEKMPGMGRVYFSNSGSEANEKAYKMVRQIGSKKGDGAKNKIIFFKTSSILLL